MKYDFYGPDTGRGKDVFALFRCYKDASDWVSRFVRTNVQHSYLFCWLASKYKEHQRGTFRDAATEMFERGMKGQGTKRHIRGTREGRRAELRSIEEHRSRVELPAIQRENFATHLDLVADRIKSYFLPKHSYTRQELRKRNERLFVTCCQLAGGFVSELHGENEGMSEELMKLYQPILVYNQDGKVEGLSRQSFERDLKKKFVDHADSALIESLFQGLDETVSVEDVKGRFVSLFANRVFDHFVTGWKDNVGKIHEEYIQLQSLYDLRAGVAVEAGEEEAGLPVHVVTGLTLPELNDEVSKSQKENLEFELTGGGEKAFIDIEIPMALQDELRKANLVGVTGGTVNYDDKPMGTIKFDQDEGKVVVERQEGVKLEDSKPDPQKISARLPSDGEEIAVELHKFDIPLGRLLPETNQDLLRVVDVYDDLTKKQNECHALYTDEKDSEGDRMFRRNIRSLLFGEALLSTPRNQVNLDAEDLSNVIGVIMEMVEHLSETDMSWFDNQPFADAELGGERLRKINLSEFYPLADDDKDVMQKILQYHYSLCQEVEEVRDYLNELQDLREFFDSVRSSDLEIQVINKTFAEYCETIETAESHVFLREPPLILYATLQSEASPSTLQEFYNKVKFYYGRSSSKELQIPLVVTSEDEAEMQAELGMPVFGKKTIRLPQLGEHGVPVSHVVQELPYLMWAASLLSSRGCDFGIVERDLNERLIRELEDAGLPEPPTRGDGIYDYLRKCWTTSDSVRNQLIMLKWLNAGFNTGAFEPGAADKNNLSLVIRELYDNEHYQAVFEGLPFGEERPRTIKVCDNGLERRSYKDLFAPNNAFVPGTLFEIDGKEVEASWLQKL